MSDNLPAIFNYESNEIRVIRNDDGDPLFVAADVCKVLNLGDTSKAVNRLDDDEKGTSSIRTPSGEQQMLVVTEPGLYALILGSRKQGAKDFKRWITHEVIPSLRKSGSYSVKPMTPAEYLLMQAEMMVAQERRLSQAETKIEQIEARQSAIEDGTDYFSILAYAKLTKRKLDNVTAGIYGKRCTKLSAELGIHVQPISDAHYGRINTYHLSVLRTIFGDKD